MEHNITKQSQIIKQETNSTSNIDLDKTVPEQNKKYFIEFIKLYEANKLLKNQLTSLLKQKNKLKHILQLEEVRIIYTE